MGQQEVPTKSYATVLRMQNEKTSIVRALSVTIQSQNLNIPLIINSIF